MTPALQIFAGPRARRQLAEQGLRPEAVRIIPAAAGGPKGLILKHLDQFIFGEWLAKSQQEVHLLGASIGAWRMSAACLAHTPGEVADVFERLAQDYVHQRYDSEPGKAPSADTVSRTFALALDAVFGGREQQVLSHPRWRLHLFTSRGRGLLSRERRGLTPLGYLCAFAANALSRQAMQAWLERVVFSDPRAPLPLDLGDYRSEQVALQPGNLQASLLASCSIPFWLRAVSEIAGARAGAYWDGGMTDYHLHLNYASMVKGRDGGASGLVLYPHFQRHVVPGWLDKGLKHRHRSSPFLDNVVLLAPHPDWVKQLPRGKLPDRADFQHYGDDVNARATAWLRAIGESARLRDEFAALCERPSIQAEAL